MAIEVGPYRLTPPGNGGDSPSVDKKQERITNEIFEMDAQTFCIYTDDPELAKDLRQNPQTTYFGRSERNGKWHAELFLFPATDYEDIAKQAGIKPVKHSTAKQQE